MGWFNCRAVLAVFAAVLLIAAAGCGDDEAKKSAGAVDEPSQEEVKIAYFGFAAANTYTQAIYDGLKAKAQDMGATVDMFDGKFDPGVQLKQITDANTSRRFGAYVVAANDPTGLIPVVKQALDDDIDVGVVNFNFGPKNDTSLQVPGLTTRVIFSHQEMGATMAQAVVDACAEKDPCRVVALWGVRTAPFEAPRRVEFKAGLEDHPNVDIVAEGDGLYLRDKSYQTMSDILQAQNDIDVIVSPSGDQMIIGAQQALDDRKIAYGQGEDDVKLIGLGGSKTAVDSVRAGDWVATYLELPKTMGEIAAEQMINAVRGESHEAFVPMHQVPLVEKCGGTLVTKEFLDRCPDFTAEWDS